VCAASGADVDGVAFRRIMPTPSEPPAGTWCPGGAGVCGAVSCMPGDVGDPWPVGAADPWPVSTADPRPVGGDPEAEGAVADPGAAGVGADPGAAGVGADPEAEAAADPGTGGVAVAGDIRAGTGAGVECALLRRIVPAGRESSVGTSWSGAAVVGRDRGTTVAVVLAERPSPAGIPGGAPPFALAEPGARCPFSTGSGRGATSLPAAPRIEPLKVISGIRRTTTGLPVIAAVVPPGACPASDGTVPTALRRFRAGRSVAGQITAAVNPAAPATRAGPGPNVGREGPGVGARGGDVSDP